MLVKSGRCVIARAVALVLGLVAVSAVGTTANAQEISAKSWTGFYIGAGVGAGAINHKVDVSPFFTFDGIGGEGIFGTIQLGADVQVGQRFVLGVFVDYDFSGIKTDASLNIPIGPGFSATAEIPVDDMWTIGARAGFLSSPSTLWYVGAGYSQMQLGDASFTTNIPNVAGSFPLPEFKGYSLLAGVESQLWHNFSIKMEYRFTQFDRESLLAIGPADLGLEPSIHAARLVASYRFNFGERHAEPLEPLK